MSKIPASVFPVGKSRTGIFFRSAVNDASFFHFVILSEAKNLMRRSMEILQRYALQNDNLERATTVSPRRFLGFFRKKVQHPLRGASGGRHAIIDADAFKGVAGEKESRKVFCLFA